MHQLKENIIARKNYLAISRSDANGEITFRNNNLQISFNEDEFQNFTAGYFDKYKNKIISKNDSYSFDYGRMKVIISPEDMESFNSVVCKACRKLFGALPAGNKCAYTNSQCYHLDEMLCIKNLENMEYFKEYKGLKAIFTKNKSEAAHFDNMSDKALLEILKTLRNYGYQVIPLAPEKNQKKYAL